VKSIVRRTDVCGVVGPTELGVLLHNTPMGLARATADNIVETLRTQQFLVRQGRARTQAWGGIVRYSARYEADSLDLLIDAETAWRRAKSKSVPVVALTQPVPPAERQDTCRSRIRAALDDNRFTLYAQPILDLSLNQVTRHEILLRLLDEANFPVPPSSFLDTAERVDEILAVDFWVLGRALELIMQGPETTHYHINLSGKSLTDGRLLEHIDAEMRRLDINPALLTFEITETAVIGNMTEARRFAHGIRELGCQLALDDFGSGYGSFTYLKYFPIDLVKIDGEFISNLLDTEADQVMVRSLVEICRALGIRTAAEFVEDSLTIELLRTYGVEFIQGYAVGKPQPIARPRGTAPVLLPPARQVPRWDIPRRATG
jgi:EAL domain-containing protein (putative c-di-GMP-specific phosphodiesterase class I)